MFETFCETSAQNCSQAFRPAIRANPSPETFAWAVSFTLSRVRFAQSVRLKLCCKPVPQALAQALALVFSEAFGLETSAASAVAISVASAALNHKIFVCWLEGVSTMDKKRPRTQKTIWCLRVAYAPFIAQSWCGYMAGSHRIIKSLKPPKTLN